MDENGDDLLDPNEFTADYFAAQSVEQQLDVFGILDSDSNGVLTLNEFVTRPARAHFRLHDTDDDGALSLKEFFVGDMPTASTKQAEAAFRFVDRDGDRLIQLNEFRDRPLAAWFIRLDIDEDSQLSAKEFETATPAAFRVLDTESDGQLSLIEFQDRKRGFDFAMRDGDGDGGLTITEFVGTAENAEKAATESDVFGMLDKDADESLTAEEFETRSAEVNFRRMDSDNSGELSTTELHQGDMPWASLDQSREAFSILDKDTSGGVSFEEFSSRTMEAWFVRSDADASKLLSLGEYARVNPNLQPKQCTAVFAALDADSDGELDLEEFCTRTAEFDFATKDQDGDGRLGVAEFVGTSAGPEKKEIESDVFTILDRDADELLTVEEFKGGSPEASFRRMDCDDSGELDAAELHQGDMPSATLEQAREALRLLDINGSEGISVSEFSSRPLEAWFVRSDEDGDGGLSFVEYSRVNTHLRGEHCQAIFEALDSNDNGKVDQDEFVKRDPAVAFWEADFDVSGFITPEEFQAIQDPEGTESAEVKFDRLDQDGDGRLSVGEYLQGE